MSTMYFTIQNVIVRANIVHVNLFFSSPSFSPVLLILNCVGRASCCILFHCLIVYSLFPSYHFENTTLRPIRILSRFFNLYEVYVFPIYFYEISIVVLCFTFGSNVVAVVVFIFSSI